MEADAFASQVLNFGQCPTQLFQAKHAQKLLRIPLSVGEIATQLEIMPADFVNAAALEEFVAVPVGERTVVALPKPIAIVAVRANDRGSYFLSSVERDSLSLIDLATGKTVCEKISVDFGYITHLSVPQDGLFLAVSYEFGRVDIFQIVYDRGTATDIHKFSSFADKSKCMGSAILTTDFICASAFEYKIVFWNVATQLRHRELSLDFVPITMMFDQFNAVLTVVGKRRMVQISVNGKNLHLMMSPKEITAAAFVGVDFAFDKRVIVTGHVDGSISLVYVDGQEYELKYVNRPLHREKVMSIVINQATMKMASVDARGGAVMVEFKPWEAGSVVHRCAKCGCPYPGRAAKRKQTICENCGCEVGEVVVHEQ
jgi:hypothetical protein